MTLRRALALGLLAATACSGGDDDDDGDDTAPAVFALELEGLDPALLAVHPLGDDGDPFAVGGPFTQDGDPALYRRANGAWSPVAGPPGWRGAIWWSHSASASDVWVVGDRGQVARGPVDALAKIETNTSTATTFYGVWGAAPDDVWIVGGALRGPSGPTAALLHYDGAALSTVEFTGTASSARDAVLFKVWGSGPDDVVIVGAGGVALHLDGATWTRSETNSTAQLTTVHGRAPDDVYAVGGLNQGVVLHWDGAAWTDIAEPFTPRLSGVFAEPDGPVWVAGDGGYLASFDGATWTTIDTGVITQFHAVHAGPRGVFATGGILAISSAPRLGFVGRYGR